MALFPKKVAPKEIWGEDGQLLEIKEEGSLGLLALGYVGLMAWRTKRMELSQQRETQTSETDIKK